MAQVRQRHEYNPDGDQHRVEARPSPDFPPWWELLDRDGNAIHGDGLFYHESTYFVKEGGDQSVLET